MKFSERIINNYKKYISLCKTGSINFYKLELLTPYEQIKKIIADFSKRSYPTCINRENGIEDIVINESKNYEEIFCTTYSDKQFVFNFIRSIHIQQACNQSILFSDETYNIYFLTKDKEDVYRYISILLGCIDSKIKFKLEISESVLLDISKRIGDVEKFYIFDNGGFIGNLYDRLADNISKISFKCFLKQRISAHIQFNNKTMYPILPPKETEEWRTQRGRERVSLPKLSGSPEFSINFFYKDTFILEQYAIEGVVEAMPGDIVIDAGAFIGDTALYFANKVGANGHVYAFEPLPSSIESAKKNIKDNDVDSIVDIIPKALSEKKQILKFTQVGIESGSYVSENGDISVQSISLDEFVSEHNIHQVDYIKSDLEGSDFEFLCGAKNTIQTFGPKLGLALYHKQDDFIKIPSFLDKIRIDYVYYFRCEAEPVLLAITKKAGEHKEG